MGHLFKPQQCSIIEDPAALASRTRVGIAKAERSMYTFLDNPDETQNVERRNAENYFTTNIESTAVANSIALDV